MPHAGDPGGAESGEQQLPAALESRALFIVRSCVVHGWWRCSMCAVSRDFCSFLTFCGIVEGNNSLQSGLWKWQIGK